MRKRLLEILPKAFLFFLLSVSDERNNARLTLKLNHPVVKKQDTDKKESEDNQPPPQLLFPHHFQRGSRAYGADNGAESL